MPEHSEIIDRHVHVVDALDLLEKMKMDSKKTRQKKKVNILLHPGKIQDYRDKEVWL